MISPGLAISAAAVYAAIYYLIARSALNDLASVDPDYYAYLGAQRGTSANNSTAIIEILFDTECPKPFYPVATRRKLSLARWLLWLSPIVLIAVVLAIIA
ncbi:hypothetical protein ABB34_05075 [Stenotrophomonas daejeonensis]|uniref:Transmembrane protein n=1 Tax=Stenotrophomonas daejeonensis TaxID=659018 RepID=A0A0R0E7B0_9GAMM|nr:hypothetical protein ABB34_05075 [Stenotrophomonas daejeonensis]